MQLGASPRQEGARSSRVPSGHQPAAGDRAPGGLCGVAAQPQWRGRESSPYIP